ncbi:MAG: hypothetical protein AB1898_27895 [Acidobacteriota bacterium]
MVPDRIRYWCTEFIFTLALGMGCLVLPLAAQFGPLLNPLRGPQAKSQEELDDFLTIVSATDAQAIIQAADHFATTFPQSEFLGVTSQWKMSACQRTGEFNCLLESGEKSLALQPDNLNALMTLASEIPDRALLRPDRAELLRKAEDYAHRALSRLGTIHIAHEISLDHWRMMKGEMEAKAHEALGRVAVLRGDLQTAVTELEWAAHKNPTPEGLQFFHLGVAYRLAGKDKEAKTAWLRAVELGPDPVRGLALGELQKSWGAGSKGKSD